MCVCSEMSCHPPPWPIKFDHLVHLFFSLRQHVTLKNHGGLLSSSHYPHSVSGEELFKRLQTWKYDKAKCVSILKAWLTTGFLSYRMQGNNARRGPSVVRLDIDTRSDAYFTFLLPQVTKMYGLSGYFSRVHTSQRTQIELAVRKQICWALLLQFQDGSSRRHEPLSVSGHSVHSDALSPFSTTQLPTSPGEHKSPNTDHKREMSVWFASHVRQASTIPDIKIKKWYDQKLVTRMYKVYDLPENTDTEAKIAGMCWCTRERGGDLRIFMSGGSDLHDLPEMVTLKSRS